MDMDREIIFMDRALRRYRRWTGPGDNIHGHGQRDNGHGRGDILPLAFLVGAIALEASVFDGMGALFDQCI